MLFSAITTSLANHAAPRLSRCLIGAGLMVALLAMGNAKPALAGCGDYVHIGGLLHPGRLTGSFEAERGSEGEMSPETVGDRRLKARAGGGGWSIDRRLVDLVSADLVGKLGLPKGQLELPDKGMAPQAPFAPCDGPQCSRRNPVPLAPPPAERDSTWQDKGLSNAFAGWPPLGFRRTAFEPHLPLSAGYRWPLDRPPRG